MSFQKPLNSLTSILLYYFTIVANTNQFVQSQQFQKNTEHANFSNSVVDVFTQLTQCFEVLQKLECQDPEVWKRYMKRFAKTVGKVLTAYATEIQNDFPNHCKDEPTVRNFKSD